VLTLDSGNLGEVDQEFDGFRTELTIGDVVLTGRTLCRGQRGANFRQTDEFEFEITDQITSDWLLIVKWFNAFDDPSRGTTRHLAVYGYELRRQAVQLYKVSIATSGTTPDRTLLSVVHSYGTTPSVPGGWLMGINSYGTTVGWKHESAVYPQNDTLVSKVPLSDVLAARTAERREDIIVTSGNFTLPDAADPAFTSFGTGFLVI